MLQSQHLRYEMIVGRHTTLHPMTHARVQSLSTHAKIQSPSAHARVQPPSTHARIKSPGAYESSVSLDACDNPISVGTCESSVSLDHGSLTRQITANYSVREEARVQQKLRQMGVCVAGFLSGGYRCAAGGHYISDAELGT
ncbi:hypothetical protein DFH29DRAFT_446497 [Suillus ampliporus]|nr:hypothetical protein DFH29DRAFT_446497 [Suillus ampliporus]